jgi:fatty-acyl-CoA synthase
VNDLSVVLERWAGFRPDHVAVRDAAGARSYGDFAGGVARWAGALYHDLGIRRGDRVAYLGLNRAELLLTLFGCARLGAAMVAVNCRLAPPEITFVLADSGAKVLTGDGDLVAAVAPHRHELVDLQVALGVGELAALAAAATPAPPAGAADDPVLICYTSGTTGRAKGAVLTQGALAANAAESRHMHDLGSGDHVLTPIPMFHVGGLNIQTTPALLSGATATLLERFDPGEWLGAVAQLRPTLSVLVPATMAAVIGHPAWAGADLSSLRSLTTGSSAVPVPLIGAFHTRGVPVIQIYGSTETGPVAIYQRREQAVRHLGTTGLPGPTTDLRIVPTGIVPAGSGDVPAERAEVAAGQPGELWLRGPQLFSGYWNNPEATAAALIDGWFRTGDIGYRDGAGQVVISDRLKDMIISGGENIYPAELEQVLATVTGVAEAAVIGRPDDRWGEIPLAVVVAAPGAMLSEADVLGAFAGRLARYKHPRAVVFVDALPRNVMGKVLKTELRARFG